MNFHLFEDDTIMKLASEIESKEGTPVDQQRLILNGRQLEYNGTLRSCGMQDMSVLHLVLRLRGGMFHESSGRRDFQHLSGEENSTITLNLILPNGDKHKVSVDQQDSVDRLKDQALSLLKDTIPAPRKRRKTASDSSDEAESPSNKQRRLRSVVFDADEEMKRLQGAILDADMQKERTLREGATASSELDDKISNLRSQLYDANQTLTDAREALLGAELEVERKKRGETTCDSSH
jgi:hypothetical protein